MNNQALVRKIKKMAFTQKAIKELKDDLSVKQLEFIEHPSKNKTIHSGRRSGKTHAIIRYLVITALDFDHVNAMYFCLSKPTAVDQIWSELSEVAIKYGAEADNLRNTLHFDNGSQITLGGVEDEAGRSKVRGSVPPKIVILDEAGTYSPAYFKSFVKEIVEPILLDHQGTLILAGTPPANASGAFADAVNDKSGKWVDFHWDFRENNQLPFIRGNKDWKKILQRKWEELQVDTPPDYFNREYGGQFIRDETNLLFLLNPHKNFYDKVPSEQFEYILALDTGFNDATAILILAISTKTNAVYVVYEFSQSKLLLNQVAEKTKEISNIYNPTIMVADPAGKQFIESLIGMYNLPFIYAKKNEKAAHIADVNAALWQGRLKFPRNSKTYDQMSRLIWNKDRTREKEGYPCDLVDTLIYAFTYVFNHRNPKSLPPEATIQEILNEEQKQLLAKRIVNLQYKDRQAGLSEIDQINDIMNIEHVDIWSEDEF